MKAIDVANFVIERSQEQNVPVTNLRLQKLLYFIQKEMLKEHKRVAFEDDIEAWQYGPVVRGVYNEFSDFIDMPLVATDSPKITDEHLPEIVDEVLSSKQEEATWKLVKETHKKGSPWHKTFFQGKDIIDINDIETLEN